MKNIINFKQGKTVTAAVITAILLVIGAGCTLNPNSKGADNNPGTEVNGTGVTETKVTESEFMIDKPNPNETGPLWNQEVDGPKSFAVFVKDQIGTPYADGGNHPDIGLDETGLITYCYKAYFALAIPSDVEEICQGFDDGYDSIPVSAIHVGDVVVYDSNNVAIYVGNGEVVYASEEEGCVCSGTLRMENIRAVKHFVDYSSSEIGLG